MAKQVINVGTTAGDGSGDALRDAMIKINANFTELYEGIVVQTIVGENGTTLVDISTNSVNANALTGTVPTGVATWANLGGKPTSVAGFGIADAYTIAQTDAQIASEIDDLKISLAADGGDLKGSVFADDSTLLVDGVAGKIVGPVEASTITSSSYVDASSVNANTYGAKTIGSFINFGVNASVVNMTTAIDMQNYSIGNVGTITADQFNGTNLSVDNGFFISLTGDLNGSVFADNSTLLVDGVNAKIVGDLSITKTPPLSSLGISGDKQGDIAVDATYLYYCFNDFTDVTLLDITNNITATGLSIDLDIPFADFPSYIDNTWDVYEDTNKRRDIVSVGDNGGFTRITVNSVVSFNPGSTITLRQQAGVSIWKRIAWSADTW